MAEKNPPVLADATSKEADAASLKVNAEVSKLTQEIKSLRLQRLITLATLAGGIIAFLVGNSDKIVDLIYRKPKIQVAVEDEFLAHNAQVRVVNRAQKDGLVVISDSLANETKWHTLEPGPYTLIIELSGSIVYQRDFTVEKGDKRTLVVGATNSSPESAAIRVIVESESTQVGPGSNLGFQVRSSGNGYLWVFDRREDQYVLIYPGDCVGDCGNGVTADQGFRLPDANNRGLKAGETLGAEERLLFLVTSSSDRNAAEKIAAHFGQKITKATGVISTSNWGYYELSYKIGE